MDDRRDARPRAAARSQRMKWLAVAGLVIDIIGVVLVWRFGLPQKEISRSGAKRLIMEDRDRAEIALARRYDRIAGVGLALLIVGFLLQLVGAWPK